MELPKETLVKWFKLAQVPGLGPQKIRKLLFFFGGLDQIYAASSQELLQTRIFSDNMLQSFQKLKLASDENFSKVIDECTGANVRILTLLDKEYPKNLLFVQSPPLSLFLSGNVELLNGNKVAVVGSRESTPASLNFADVSSNFFATSGFSVVSGGAIGIDSAAHKGALRAKGKTIAVLGSGFNFLFPQENIDLFKEIKEKGLLISEHLPNFKGSRISYLQRNRITSGLSDALLLVAAKAGGGSLTQASIAYAQKKPIFCPSLELNLLPNDGIKEAISRFGAIQIKNSTEILDSLKTKS